MSRDGHFELGDLPARNRAHLERNPANGQISRYACSNDSKQPYCIFVYQRVCLPASRLIVVPVISVVLFGTFMFDIDDVLGQQDFLYPAQVADLREFAQATEAGEGSLQQTLRQRETGELTFTGSSSRPPSRRPLFASAAPAIARGFQKPGSDCP
jgi:hypothetical protein